MSKLTKILKYEMGADVIPGSLRTMFKNVPSKSDYVDAYRTLMRVFTTVTQIELLKDVPQNTQSDSCQMPLWISYLIAFGIGEAIKYGADRGTASIANRTIGGRTQTNDQSLESRV